MNLSRRNRGFTLIELMLVMVILAILAAIVVPKFTGKSEQARVAAAKTDIAGIETALDAFEIENGRYPTTEEGLAALMEAPSGLKKWNGPYLKRLSPDPWGQPYNYRYPGTHTTNGYDLYSYGPEGREGGAGQVDNWTVNP
jgi:general secretion pathway protein G